MGKPTSLHGFDELRRGLEARDPQHGTREAHESRRRQRTLHLTPTDTRHIEEGDVFSARLIGEPGVSFGVRLAEEKGYPRVATLKWICERLWVIVLDAPCPLQLWHQVVASRS